MDKIFNNEIKLIVSEIDGVLTDGLFTEDEIGNTLYKKFNVKDLAAINEIKKYCKVVFLSDDQKINYNMCNRRHIPFYWGKGEKGKVKALREIMLRYSATPDEVIYIGSKITDRSCMQMIPHSFCPDDVGEYLRSLAWGHFLTISGEGIFVELLDLLLKHKCNDKNLDQCKL